MRSAILLLALSLTRAVNAQEAEPPPTSPPTARFELVSPEPEPPPVADDSRLVAPTVPQPEEWRPISNSTDYGGGFDRPWSNEGSVERRWYGEQTLLADVISIGLIASALNGDADERGGAGFFGYLLASPIIHAAHGHVGKSFASLGVRMGAPIVGAVIGVGLDDCSGSGDRYDDDQWCGDEGALAGAMIGTIAAAVFDAAVIASEDVKPEVQPERVSMSADVRLERDRAELSLRGTF